jgi:hypothetical protein
VTHIDLQKRNIDSRTEAQWGNVIALAGVLGHMKYLQGGKWTSMRMKIALEGIETDLAKVTKEIGK